MQTQLTHRRVAATAGMLAALTAAASADAQVFNDLGAFQAAAGATALETFESIPAGTQLDTLPGLGIGFATLNDDVTFPSVQPQGSTGGDVVSGTQVLLNDIDFTLPGLGPIGFAPLAANDGIFAAGFFNTGADDNTTLTLFDADDNVILSGSSSGSPGFIGIVTAAPAARAQINEFGGNGYFTLDDLYVRTAPIPEPATLGSLAAVAVLSLARRGR